MVDVIRSSEDNRESLADDVVLSVEGVSKKFCRSLKRSLFYGLQDIGKEILGLQGETDRLRKGEFWALKDVSFQLRRGEALGLVGANGAGKTTLLRIISGLIRPDQGQVTVKGRVAPLIALGAGFNPVLTGRENIYANMAILGLSKAEIDQRFQDVVDFAEIGDALDAPVQSYSSGMQARLGFACAIYVEPDVLLIDEVLAVGDLNFKAKCNRQIVLLQQRGTAFVMVSHHSHALLSLCNCSVYLQNGTLKSAGKTIRIIRKYEQEMLNSKATSFGKCSLHLSAKNPQESHGLNINYLLFRDAVGKKKKALKTAEGATLCVGLSSVKKFLSISIHIKITSIDGSRGVSLVISSLAEETLAVFPGQHEIQMVMPCLSLKPGHYRMRVMIRDKGFYTLDVVDVFDFTVKNGSQFEFFESDFYQPRSWKLVNKTK